MTDAAAPPKQLLNLPVPQTVLKRGVTPDLLRRSRSRRSRSCTPLIQRADRETTPFELTQNVHHTLASSLCVFDKALVMDITAEKEDNPVEVLTSDFSVFDHAAVMDISTGEFVIEYEEYEEEIMDDVSVISADDTRSEFDESEARSESEPPRSGSEAPSEAGDVSEAGDGDAGGEAEKKPKAKKKTVVKKAVVKKKVVKKEEKPKAKGKSPAKKGATPPKGKVGGVAGAAGKFSQPNDAPKPPKAVKPKKKSKSPSPKRGATPQKSAAEAAELAKKAREEEEAKGDEEEGDEDVEDEEEAEEEQEPDEEEEDYAEEEEPEPEPEPEPEIVYTDEDLLEQELIRKRVVYSPEYRTDLWDICTEDPPPPPPTTSTREEEPKASKKGRIVGRLLTEKEYDQEWQRERESRKLPLLLNQLAARTVVEHTPIKLSCSVDGEGVQVKWLKNGALIPKNANQTAKDGLMVLDLPDPTKDDSGVYSCVIKNKNGEVSTSATVSVYQLSSELVISPSFVSVRGIRHCLCVLYLFCRPRSTRFVLPLRLLRNSIDDRVCHRRATFMCLSPRCPSVREPINLCTAETLKPYAFRRLLRHIHR